MRRSREGAFKITRLANDGEMMLTFHLIVEVSYTPVEDGLFNIEDIRLEHVEIEMVTNEDGVEIPAEDPLVPRLKELAMTYDEMEDFLGGC
jgi:hypothetical protein